MAKHLRATATAEPMLTPSYYLTPDTKDYPLALLLDGCAPDPDSDLPVAHGVRFITEGSATCIDCGQAATFMVEVTESGGGNPAYEVASCAACTVGGDHRGIVPMCYMDLIPYE